MMTHVSIKLINSQSAVYDATGHLSECSICHVLCPLSCTTALFVQCKKKIWCLNEAAINTALSLLLFFFLRGPPKHKPPPPVKAGSSTEMVSGRRGLGSIFIVAAIIFCTHVQTHTVHLGSHNGANGYWLEIWVGLCVEIISLVF